MKNLVFPLFIGALFIATVVLSPALFPPEETAVNSARYEQSVISLANVSIPVEIPLSRAGFEKGLGERAALSENSGMLFLCLPDAYPRFSMKGMRFPIDIVWIDNTFTVVEVSADISPESFPAVISPTNPARHALEVNGGFAKAHAITPGTTVYGLGGSSCERNS